MTTPYIDPNLIFAENAPSQDKPAGFENYDKGWDESRKNDGRPSIKQMNYLQQQADLKNRYIHENGAALPYKESISYEDGAVVVKDGVLQQLNGGVWVILKPEHNDLDGRDVVGAHPASAILDASGESQQDVNNYIKDYSNKNLKHYAGADPSGVTNSSTALQAYVNDVNTQQLSVLYAPTVWENYVIDDKIICEYPISIKGDKLPNQNRYFGKRGNFLIGETDVGFTFGNGRTDYPEVPYIADQYNVQNIGFLQKDGEFTKTAIVWDIATNAPDRGCRFDQVSASRLDKFFHLKNNRETDLASLVVENSCLSNCNYVLYSKGALNGLRFVGNQAEQSVIATIYGCFNGAIYIADNMLEGALDTIFIDEVPVTGNRPNIVFERNYIEWNFGRYLMSLNSTVNGHLTIRDNFHFDLDEFVELGRLQDVVVMRGDWTFINNADDFQITLDSGFTVIAEPRLSAFGDYHVRVDTTNYQLKNLVTSEDLSKLAVTSGIKPNYVPQKVQTNQGELYYLTIGGGDRIATGKPIKAGDIVKINFAYYSNYSGDLKTTPLSIGINDETLTYGSNGSLNIVKSESKVKVASIVFVSTFNANNPSLVFGHSAFDDLYILNADVQVIKSSVSETEKVTTHLSMPKLLETRDGLNFEFELNTTTGVVVPANSSTVKTISIDGVSTNNNFSFKLKNPNGNIRFSVESVSANSLTVRIFNSSNASISLTEHYLGINVK